MPAADKLSKNNLKEEEAEKKRKAEASKREREREPPGRGLLPILSSLVSPPCWAHFV